MIALRDDRIGSLTAWPVDLLSIASSRALIGLLMPKVSGRKDIHHLYSPKSRRVDFHRADWRFLIRASANTARAFAVVHESGCIIGDVNHGGARVALSR
jgi:DNA-binding helix-hairpin-helix protein with protein kinase domain